MIVETEMVETKRGAAFGIRARLGDTPLLIIKGERGYLACAYLDRKTVDKLGDTCAIIPGAKSFQEMLRKRVDFASKSAQKLGVKRGMTGVRALDKLI